MPITEYFNVKIILKHSLDWIQSASH